MTQISNPHLKLFGQLHRYLYSLQSSFFFMSKKYPEFWRNFRFLSIFDLKKSVKRFFFILLNSFFLIRYSILLSFFKSMSALVVHIHYTFNYIKYARILFKFWRSVQKCSRFKPIFSLLSHSRSYTATPHYCHRARSQFSSLRCSGSFENVNWNSKADISMSYKKRWKIQGSFFFSLGNDLP